MIRKITKYKADKEIIEKRAISSNNKSIRNNWISAKLNKSRQITPIKHIINTESDTVNVKLLDGSFSKSKPKMYFIV